MSSASASPRLCSGCEAAIPAIRLQAKPNARLCVSCQSKQDVMIKDAAVDMNRLSGLQLDDNQPDPSILNALTESGLLSSRGFASLVSTDWEMRRAA
jgi:Prokaryotic dksA/traR C4-type zinc finger